MADIVMTVELVEGKELAKRLQDSGTVKGPAEDGIKRITLKLEAEAKKATVVDTGRLRASMSHRYTGMGAEVGTNVNYASFVEYGHQSRSGGDVPARHMEGSIKVLGLGMLGYALRQLKDWVDKEGDEIAKKIAEKIHYGR